MGTRRFSFSEGKKGTLTRRRFKDIPVLSITVSEPISVLNSQLGQRGDYRYNLFIYDDLYSIDCKIELLALKLHILHLENCLRQLQGSWPRAKLNSEGLVEC
jgi:hypothetical protein